MNKNQITGLLNMINAAYPQFSRHYTEAERTAQLRLWFMMLENDDPVVVAKVVNKHIALSKYPPTIAEIREGIRNLTMPDPSDLFDILFKQGVVSMIQDEPICVDKEKNLWKCETYEQEAFNKLPQILQEYVKSPKGLQAWYVNNKNRKEEARKRFISDIVEVYEQADLKQLRLTGE